MSKRLEMQLDNRNKFAWGILSINKFTLQKKLTQQNL